MAQVQLYTAETAMAGTIEALKVQGQATLQRKTAALYKIMPWANGKGNTTELYVFPKEGKLTDRSAVWRVSMASVTENGPFSVLPDYERIITVAQGAGFHIKGNMGTDVVVAPGVKYAFSGKETIECELIGGRCVGLNVFYRKEVSRAELKLLGQGEPLRFGITTQEKEVVIVVCLEGIARVRAHGKGEGVMLPNDSVYFTSNDGPGRLAVSTQASSRVALVAIEGF